MGTVLRCCVLAALLVLACGLTNAGTRSNDWRGSFTRSLPSEETVICHDDDEWESGQLNISANYYEGLPWDQAREVWVSEWSISLFERNDSKEALALLGFAGPRDRETANLHAVRAQNFWELSVSSPFYSSWDKALVTTKLLRALIGNWVYKAPKKNDTLGLATGNAIPSSLSLVDCSDVIYSDNARLKLDALDDDSDDSIPGTVYIPDIGVEYSGLNYVSMGIAKNPNTLLWNTTSGTFNYAKVYWKKNRLNSTLVIPFARSVDEDGKEIEFDSGFGWLTFWAHGGPYNVSLFDGNTRKPTSLKKLMDYIEKSGTQRPFLADVKSLAAYAIEAARQQDPKPCGGACKPVVVQYNGTNFWVNKQQITREQSMKKPHCSNFAGHPFGVFNGTATDVEGVCESGYYRFLCEPDEDALVAYGFVDLKGSGETDGDSPVHGFE
ncbi:hypothetical protein QOT17_014016 [Balamuthia mandrillaris]